MPLLPDPDRRVFSPLAEIHPQCSSLQRASAERVVRSKHALDDTLRTEDRLDPLEFIRGSLPFASFSDDPPWSALVPSELVIGCSWRYGPNPGGGLSDSQRHARRASALKPEMADPHCQDHAEFAFIRPLGLFAAHEGKNRVRLLRAFGDPLIPALVSPMDYPDPSRITRYIIPVAARMIVLLVLDGRWLARPEHYSQFAPILDAYGVATMSWPRDFPSARDVLAACVHVPHFILDQHPGRPRTLDRWLLDLKSIA